MAKYKGDNLTSKQRNYLINKYMATAGGLNPKNIEVELEDGYEFGTKIALGRECVTIKKKES